MIRHWTRHLRPRRTRGVRRHMMRSRVINTFGLAFTAVVLVIVLITKFLAGAWIAILAMVHLLRDHARHPPPLRQRRAGAGGRRGDKILPTRVHAIVLVSKLHKPTLRALAFAKATRPNVLEGVYVASDPASTDRLLRRVGRAQPRRPAQGAALALPRGRPADRRLRHRDPEGQPARRGRGLHPGVRRRALVGAAPAQPDRAAAQGPAALHARA